MKISDSVRLAIEDWELAKSDQTRLESAMLHACNALDGTAKKIWPKANNKDRFTRLIRQSYDFFGPMAMPCIDLENTVFSVPLNSSKKDNKGPDIADIIYSIHRCSHAHGDELEEGFSLIEDVKNDIIGQENSTNIRSDIEGGKVRLSDRTIFGLLGIAVFSPINKNQSDPKLYNFWLTFDKDMEFHINDWWGKKEEFLKIISQVTLPKIILNPSR